MTDEKEGIGPDAETTPPEASEAQTKAALDTGKVTAPSDRSVQKVELDLDDAAFLDEEDDIEEEPAKPEKKQPAKKIEKKARKPFTLKEHKKSLSAGIVLFLVAAVLVWRFVVRPAPQVTPPEPLQQEEAVSPPAKEQPAEPAEHVISFEPFWLEFDVNGDYRFLTCRFAFPVEGDLLKTEVETKRVLIRDAVYYYFKNKDIVFLGDSDNSEKLKTDLLEIINQYLGNGQLQEILIQEYRVE
jgi:flagellar FliL protein